MPSIKIINDPVYGFVKIPRDVIFGVIEHPYFQRLRHIKQLGLTHMVYPGALHTRFHHALGAFHLMTLALDTLKSKGVKITDEETEAASLAILLHDAGHGPFSHALESTIANGIHHEAISVMLMERLNTELGGKMSLAIKIFNGEYEKNFLHQLVSSQLDVDRLDYLNRDSFYTGVHEGVIGSDRIIMMMNVVDNELVIEDKGIYSIEKFLLARRFMYWQVYLHKAVVSAEQLLIKILTRAKELSAKGEELFATPALHFFLNNKINDEDFRRSPLVLDTFAALDDTDILASVKVWMNHHDKVLSLLCKKMIHRQLYKTAFYDQPAEENLLTTLREKTAKAYGISATEANYFVFSDVIENSTYSSENFKINILTKSGKVVDIVEASDQYDLHTLNKTIKKYFICHPKDLA
ncbi:MAG: HD domain-containing protein [Bacteroidetes bacterium]|nr:HD domain-containing protein [Bacteroidota bacterium]